MGLTSPSKIKLTEVTSLLIQALSFERIGEKHVFEVFVDGDLGKIDMVLYRAF